MFNVCEYSDLSLMIVVFSASLEKEIDKDLKELSCTTLTAFYAGGLSRTLKTKAEEKLCFFTIIPTVKAEQIIDMFETKYEFNNSGRGLCIITKFDEISSNSFICDLQSKGDSNG